GSDMTSDRRPDSASRRRAVGLDEGAERDGERRRADREADDAERAGTVRVVLGLTDLRGGRRLGAAGPVRLVTRRLRALVRHRLVAATAATAATVVVAGRCGQRERRRGRLGLVASLGRDVDPAVLALLA